MSSHLNSMFPLADLEKISNAVKEAEKKTSGEIVPFIVTTSDHYESAILRAALFGGLLSLAIMAGFRHFSKPWFFLSCSQSFLIVIGFLFVSGLVTFFIPPLKRFFAGHTLMDHRVTQKAAEAFLSQEVFHTKNRTGILVFLSLFERRVLVMGDAGINAKVKKSDWDGIVSHVIGGIRAKKPTEGLVKAIRECGLLLLKHGLTRSADDADELSDSVILNNQSE